MSRSTFAIAAVAILALAQPALARDRSRPAQLIGDITQWLSRDAYPPAALREGAEGRVVVVLTVTGERLVSDCRVVTSSGYASLDTATCSLATHRARFTPALDKRGHPVATTYRLPGIRWQMPRSAPVTAAPPVTA